MQTEHIPFWLRLVLLRGERHYAGWRTDLGSAIWCANEIYEGRDSIEAALVIGNGPKGVEVVYRIGEDN